MATVKELKRMCDTYEDCSDCPFGDTCCGDSVLALPDNADEIVDKWVLEHPIKTYAMDFFEKFPNADTYKEDVLPVIHAKWEPDEESSVEKPCYRCSNCGAVLEEDYNWHYHVFCFHCGARMDGEENESS